MRRRPLRGFWYWNQGDGLAARPWGLSDAESPDHRHQDGRAGERDHDAAHEADLALDTEETRHDLADERPDDA